MPAMVIPRLISAKYTDTVNSLKTIVAEEGTNGVWKGFGYSSSIPSKVATRDLLISKDAFMNLGSAIWLADSASAEFSRVLR
jgi:solute carrier family 25 phosphate transporter 3